MVQSIQYVELPNQIKIPYVEKGSPLGIPLILLHGLDDSLYTFELVLAGLPDSIHAIAMTQRGHGDASHPESGYRTNDFVADLVMFMDALMIKKAVILGASSGGFIARSFAINHPERTLGLVLLGAPHTLSDNPSVLETWDSTISKLIDPVDPEFVRSFTNNLVLHKVPQEFMEKAIEQGLKVSAQVWKETVAGILEEQFPGKLAGIQVPTLIIWGEQDTILSRAGQEELARTIVGSRLVVHSGTGHLLYWEEPELVAADIIAFVNEIPSKEGVTPP